MTSKASTLSQINPDIIAGVKVNIDAYIGGAMMTIGALTALGNGDVVQLDSQLGQEVELKLNGVVIAIGELVAVEDNFAVRITDIAEHAVSPIC